MQTGTIVRRNAKTFIPNAFLEKVLEANPNGWGAAIVSDTDGEKSLLINHGTDLTVEFIQETMQTFEKNDITFYFANSEDALSEESTSPYILVEMDGVPKIIAFIEGNFPGHAKTDSALPPEYHMVHEVLKDKFQGLYDMVDGDLTKLMETVKKPFFRKEMLLNSVSRGNITIVAANGESVSFVQGDTQAEFPWGWTSNTHGYVAEGKKEPPKEPPKKAMFEKIGKSTVREKATPSSPAAAEAAASAPKAETAVIKNYTTKKEKPPAHLSRKDKGNWYKHKIGYKPKGWENAVSVDVYVDPQGKVMSFSQVKALGTEAIGVMQLAKNPERDKDTETENLPETKMTNAPAAGEKAVTTEVLPLMSPDSRKYVQNMMKDAGVQKTISENADMILKPDKVQQQEAKFADFAKQLGDKVDITDFIKWSYEMRLKLAQERPDASANMNHTFAIMLAKYMLKEGNTELSTPAKKKPMFEKLSAAG
jgi:hypothetical protein